MKLATGGQAATDNVATLQFSFGGAGTSGGHLFALTCHVLPDLAHDVVLGLPFLREHNPDVDWA